jgi:amidase
VEERGKSRRLGSRFGASLDLFRHMDVISSFGSATTVVHALANREVSAAELADMAIARIEALDGDINAVVVRDFERARAAAKAADAALAREERRPLLGLPMTVKEAVNVAGLQTTWGVPRFKGWMAKQDTVAVARLKAAGAVILGKTNVAPWLADWQSDNPVYGRTNNPYDVTRTSGGSSGGAAAAVATGMTPLELGSDLAGSLRIPAAFCGIYAHKPSYGLVPIRGFAPPGIDGAPLPLAVLGPMARTAEDLALALDVLAGPDEDDAVGYRLELPPARRSKLRDYRVLVLDHHPGAVLDDEVRSAMHSLADRLAALGVQIERGSKLQPNLTESDRIFGDIMHVVGARGSQPASDEPSAQDWLDLSDAQLALRRRWATCFQTVDVVLTPVTVTVAFPHVGGQDVFARTLTVNGETVPYVSLTAWIGMATVANLPATTAPIGRTVDGLPIGVQVIGPYLEDRTTIEFARLLAGEVGGFTAPHE